MGENIEIFVVSEPVLMDVFDLCPKSSDRHGILLYASRQGDREGCDSLIHPEVMRPNCKLLDPKVPVICLLDVLLDAGLHM